MRNVMSVAALFCLVSVHAHATVILAENFESGVLIPQMSMQTVGTFNAPPGIQNITNFGSTEAFGFGISTCAANCFANFSTTLTITLPQPTFVTTLNFEDMDLYGDWGSNGNISVNGVFIPPLPGDAGDFGKEPYNSGIADTTYRSDSFSLNEMVSTISFRVDDITNQSELFVDNIVLDGTTNVAEPPTFALLIAALLVMLGIRNGVIHYS